MIDVYTGQIMTEELITVDQSQTLSGAAAIMGEMDIKSVIVSDADDRPVGILTSTDFVRMAADEQRPSESSVADYMRRDIVTTTADTNVHEAAELMIEHNISHLPVVLEDDRLTGIVTTTDVATYVSRIENLLA